jgi:toxin-antitoxin system PIN domain toxin
VAINLPDVNVLVYAFRADSEHHESARSWIEGALSGHDSLVLLELTIAGFLRIATDGRIFRPPTPLAHAVEAIEELLAWPDVEWACPDELQLRTIVEIAPHTHGPHIPDAYLAAAALNLDATLVSYDRDFTSYRGLRWFSPQRG